MILSMTLAGTFLFNLLCGLVPCDLNFDKPQIQSNPGGFISTRNKELTKIEPIVQTESGFVDGYMMTTFEGRDIFAFEGIPYGQARRFRIPEPIKPWNGIRQAKKPGPECLQWSLQKYVRVSGREDCLFLNVFSPRIPGDAFTPKYPVILWIHGGSYLMGQGDEFGGSYLLDHEVVLVTINYRLGPLGFLSTGDHFSPGNYGLKDQQLAMKWVNQNIEKFGGDKDRVTLMGQSAGGASAHLHMMSNESSKYFQNAISFSSSGINDWAFQSKEQARGWTNRLANQLGCPTHDSQRLMNCLERINPNRLVGQQMFMFDWFPSPPAFFGPCLEDKNNPDSIITETPEDSYAKNLTARKPWINTILKEEGFTVIYVLRTFARLLPARLTWKTNAKYLLGLVDILGDQNPQRTKKLADIVTKFYLGNNTPMNATFAQLAQMFTERFFAVGQNRAVQLHSQIAPTYSYLFSYRGRGNLGKMSGFLDSESGIGHIEDVFYFFNNSRLREGFKANEPDAQIAGLVQNLITNFAKKGEPFYTNEDGEDEKIWDQINPTNMRYLEIAQNVKMIPQPFLEGIQFWRSLGLPFLT